MWAAASMHTPILTIARYTIKGYIKERVLLVVLFFAIILIASSYLLAPLAVGAQQKIIVDVGLAAISVFGILLVVLLGAGAQSREKSRGVLPGLLARPISRVDYVVGRYVGTTVMVTTVMAIMTVVYALVMRMGGSPFSHTVLIAVYLSVLEVALVTAVMTFFASFSSPSLGAFFTLCVFVSGHLSADLLSFAEKFGGAGFRVVASTGYYVLPNLALFNIRSEAVHGLPLMEGYVYSVTVYAMFYTLVLLFLSSVIFRRRDIT